MKTSKRNRQFISFYLPFGHDLASSQYRKFSATAEITEFGNLKVGVALDAIG